jgi:hypothetical protein
MRKASVINDKNSMGFMLMLAIAMANGSKSPERCQHKRMVRIVAADTTESVLSR